MLNTPENRDSFVKKFYYKHPDGPYEVNDRTANKVLSYLDRCPEVLENPYRLWSFIMQDRVSYMLGERYIIEHESTGKKVTNTVYKKIGIKVTDDIIDFVNNLTQ